jgi:hypothetical protein
MWGGEQPNISDDSGITGAESAGGRRGEQAFRSCHPATHDGGTGARAGATIYRVPRSAAGHELTQYQD